MGEVLFLMCSVCVRFHFNSIHSSTSPIGDSLQWTSNRSNSVPIRIVLLLSYREARSLRRDRLDCSTLPNIMIRSATLIKSILRELLLHQGGILAHPQIRRIQHQKRHHNHWECPHLPPLHHWLSTPILAICDPSCLNTSLPTPSFFPSNQIPTSRFHKGIISQCNSGG